MSKSIFDATGMLRTDLENVEVAPEQLPAFEALVAARQAETAAERDVIEKEKIAATRARAHADNVAAQPKHTFLDEWRGMVASGPFGRAR